MRYSSTNLVYPWKIFLHCRGNPQFVLNVRSQCLRILLPFLDAPAEALRQSLLCDGSLLLRQALALVTEEERSVRTEGRRPERNRGFLYLDA